ncbi:hypothetical protein [Heyndrickxia coagulans]|uniref:hypothetical protein n=1 Tax=Heyndrickxia coagulans TaxID=1398 RepID=UPI00105C10E6|nr:hypothetical protein [Heyndrickxia coagulans]MBF8418081.1 hypothetical protein [Heyndrickxia coagulans]
MFPYLIGFLVQFPQEKKYYIPALISLSFFVLLAVLVFFIFRKINEKQAKKLEEEIMKKNRFPHSD